MPQVALRQMPAASAARRIAGYTVAAGAVVFAAAHLPFLPASLEDLDSINFALGLRDFDVAHHQPHPPGYPLFIGAGKIVRLFVPSEVHALALLSVIAGAVALFALVAVFRRLDEGPEAEARSVLAALVAATSPLYWFTAVRPLSDMTGLAAALGVQVVTLSAATPSALAVASYLAAFGAGVRSQVAWLTVPLLVVQGYRLVRDRGANRYAVAVRATVAFVLGGLTWGIPLLVLSGGPIAYWQALWNQGSEDLSGVRMLWTTPTVREFASAMYYAFVAPWALEWVAAVVLVLAVAGAARVTRRTLIGLVVAFGPYLIFDVVFQETVTTRYSLPIVLPVAFLAVAGLSWLSIRPAAILAILLAAYDAHLGGTSVAAFARDPAPAFRMIGDLQAVHAIAPELLPVAAMHRREAFDLRRPFVWTGAAMPAFAAQLPSPPKHEWLQLVNYWNGGGRDLVWFFADPLRTDFALIDHPSRPNGSYRWKLPYPVLLGGVRPDGMDWYSLRPPGWYLGEGWSLTPETAGLATEDGRGPGRAPIEGWIRRRSDPALLMIGGRNLNDAGGAPAHARVALDGRTIAEIVAPPGFFLQLLPLGGEALAGAGDYAALTVSADSPRVAIEQFDAQSADRVVFGFGEGWLEQEYKPATGLVWRWMTERGVLRVHSAGHDLALTLAGDPPSVYFSRPSHVRVSAGGRVVAETDLSDTFEIHARIPASLLGNGESTITIETDQMYVPAERSRRSPDRRHLGLKVFECRLEPVS